MWFFSKLTSLRCTSKSRKVAIFSRAVLRPKRIIQSRAASSSSKVSSINRCATLGVSLMSFSKGARSNRQSVTLVVAVTSNSTVVRPGLPRKSDGNNNPTICVRPSSRVLDRLATPLTTEATNLRGSPRHRMTSPAS